MIRQLFRFLGLFSLFVFVSSYEVLANQCSPVGFNYQVDDGALFAARHSTSVFKISANGESGTGFLISETTGITAKHVLTDSNQSPHSEISVRFVNSATDDVLEIDANEFVFHPTLDIALIRLPEAVKNVWPLELAFSREVFSDQFPVKMYGMSGTSIDSDVLRRPAGNKGEMVFYGGSEAQGSYASHASDSGAPIVLDGTNLVVGLHVERTAGSSQRNVVATLGLEAWLATNVLEQKQVLMLEEFKNIEVETLKRHFVPATCSDLSCWLNLEIVSLVDFLVDNWNDVEDSTSDRIVCPLLQATLDRSLTRATGKLNAVLSNRTADGAPSQEYVDFIRAAVRELENQSRDSVPNYVLAGAYREASDTLLEAGIAEVISSGERALGRLCANGQRAVPTTTLVSPIQSEIGEWSPYLSSTLTELENVIPTANCNNSYRNEIAAGLFFDAAVAQQRGLEFSSNRDLADLRRVTLAYAAASSYTSNSIRQNFSLLGLAETNAFINPDFAAEMSARAYATGHNQDVARANYDYLISLAQSDEGLAASFPDSVDVAADLAEGNLADIYLRASEAGVDEFNLRAINSFRSNF